MSYFKVRAGLEEVPLNFGSDQITFNTPCGTYDDSAFRDDSKKNSSENYEERLNDLLKYLK